MAKANEQAQIDFIADLLRKGHQRKDILGKFGKKWEKVSRTTFDRRLRDAEKQMQSELKQINERTEESIKKEVEARKTKILTALERQEILAKIALGELEIEQEVATNTGVKIVRLKPDFNERKGAIAELNKMDGSYAPAKSEVENKGAIRVIRE